ncbi:DUF7159 family protein [Mycobacterium deserti]|uniref:FHA domain-containing protein n=1 Tax=Mycobacterium deserti TaxID=2978347 RepID=A0ABT2MC87_9MYCO|nr:hypothetical protein [Mycobacterium deserti]MCT7658755.1 hypothetical protein [Mycobacterium deserti]
MDVVLGLSMTSRAVRWVLVEGTTGEGATLNRGAFDLDMPVDPEDLLDVLLVSEVESQRVHAIGVTWTNEAQDAATGILNSLTARGFDNVIAVSELEAADVLAGGIAGIAEYDDVAVCIVEPDAALVAVVDSSGVTADRIARPLDGADVVELPSSVLAMLELDDWRPDAVFVVGSATDLDVIVSTLDAVTEAPVFSAAEAELALARGAALASANAVNALTPARSRIPSKVGALASVVAAAVVTFVVALSAALGLQLSSPSSEPQTAGATEPAAAAEAAAPEKPRRIASIEEARPVVAQTIVVAAPPPRRVAPEPVYDPPAYVPPAPRYTPPAPAYTPPAPAYTPPAPAYVPPPAPAYVPPPQVPNYVPPVQQQPRLRDRIIERLPIINRFHEPDYQAPR